MQKFGDIEKIDVLRGREASVLNEHMRKSGTYSVSDFSDDQKEELIKDLEEARQADAAEKESESKDSKTKE